MNSKKDVKINHTYHGYSDGHKLLETTLNLSKESEKIMLIMSDMSGPSMVQGFESYITGYPLQNEELYAIARTWYAPEMKRPGCVWTHTLLINFKDLGEIDNNVLSLFVRPSYDVGNKPELETSLVDMFSDNLDNMVPLVFAAPLIEALYSSVEKPVIIPALESRQYEALIMAIWNQQWSSLKKSFYFCTGAIANRKIGSRIFDLQVVPFMRLNDLRRELPTAAIIDMNFIQRDIPEWVRQAVNDLGKDSNNSFSDFLDEFADDVRGGRSAFALLARMFLDIGKVRSHELYLNDLTYIFSKNFPTAQDARKLKSAIYGSEGEDKPSFLPYLHESELLQELATTTHYQIFDSKVLNIHRRAKKLWKNDRTTAKKLLFSLMRGNLNALGEEFLKGLSEGFEPFEISEFAENKNTLVYVFARLNPNLATSSQFWGLIKGKEHDVLDVIDNNTLTQGSKMGITKAILNAGVKGLATKVELCFKKEAVEALLDWINETPDRAYGLSPEWKYLIKKHPQITLAWLTNTIDPREYVIYLIITLLNPNSTDVIKEGASIWLNLAQKMGGELSEEARIKTMAFLLALSFNNPKDGSDELVALSFEIVHDATANNKLGYHFWQYLETHLPSLGWWRNWDKCERLRQGLVESYINYDWPISRLSKTIQQQETFQRIVETCNTTNKGRKFLVRLFKAAQDDKNVVTEKQLTILQKMINSNNLH